MIQCQSWYRLEMKNLFEKRWHSYPNFENFDVVLLLFEWQGLHFLTQIVSVDRTMKGGICVLSQKKKKKTLIVIFPFLLIQTGWGKYLLNLVIVLNEEYPRQFLLWRSLMLICLSELGFHELFHTIDILPIHSMEPKCQYENFIG